MKLLTLLNENKSKLYDRLFPRNATMSYFIKNELIDEYRRLSISFHQNTNKRKNTESSYKLRIIIYSTNKDDFGDDHENSIRLYSNDLSKLYMLLKPITIIMRKNKDINSTAKQLNNIPKRKVKMMMVNKFEDNDTLW